MPFDAGPPSMSTAPTWPEFDAGLLPGGPASQTIFGATPANQFLGPIATDGDQVFWVAESSTGATPLLACAVTGCPDNTPQVVWPESSWGPNGGLVVVGGRVYFFEETFNSDAGTYGGAIVDCPVSGCGAAPTTFAAIQTQVDYVEDTPGLVTDGASLYWIDGQAVLACDLGGACAAPRTVATLPAGASASATATDGSSLFWIQYTSDGNPASIESVSTAGGNLTEACSVAPEYGATLAVVGSYVYMAGGYETIYRCLVTGGAATVYATQDEGVQGMMATDGASLFWLTYALGWAYLVRCAPGSTCSDRTNIGGVFADPYQSAGFTVFGGSAYTAGAGVLRTPYCPTP